MDLEFRERISNTTALSMMMVSSLITIPGLIPIVGIFYLMLVPAVPLQYIIMWFWFKSKGAKFTFSIKVAAAANVGGAAGAALSKSPAAKAYGKWLIALPPLLIWLNIKAIQAEDAAYNASIAADVMAQREERMRIQQEYLMQLYEEQEEEEQLALQQATQDAEDQYEDEEEYEDEEIEAPAYAFEEQQEEEDTGYRGENAYAALKNKPNKTSEEQRVLERANRVRLTGKLAVADRNEPILVAAYNDYYAEAVAVEQQQAKLVRRKSSQIRPNEPENPEEAYEADEVGAMRSTTDRNKLRKLKIQPAYDDNAEDDYRQAA